MKYIKIWYPFILLLIPVFLISQSNQWVSRKNIETIATSFTGGSVVFSNGNNLAQDNANFFWDNTNNRLGVGTASPGTIVDVLLADATTDAVADMITLNHTGGTVAAGFGSGIIFEIEDAGGSEEQASIDVSLDVVTDDSEEASIIFRHNVAGTMQETMRIDGTAGYVGIGTATPTTNLTVVGGFSIGDTVGYVLAGAANVGTATLTNNNVILDTGSAAALDTATTLTGVIGQVIYISTRNSGRDVTFLDDANFLLGGTRALNNINDVLTLKAITTTVWKEVNFADNE